MAQGPVRKERGLGPASPRERPSGPGVSGPGRAGDLGDEADTPRGLTAGNEPGR